MAAGAREIKPRIDDRAGRLDDAGLLTRPPGCRGVSAARLDGTSLPFERARGTSAARWSGSGLTVRLLDRPTAADDRMTDLRQLTGTSR